MKGLLVKDFRLMKNQKQFFMVMALICMSFLAFYKSPGFCISYMTIMISIFTISTISYDEYDNGYAYLFTLPITKKSYVAEKYVFGLLIMTISLTGISAISYGAFMVRSIELEGAEWITIILSSMVIVIFMIAFTIPLQLKFGSEKSSIAMIGAIATAFLIAFLLVKLAGVLDIDMDAVFTRLIDNSLAVIILMILAVCAVMIVVSYAVSVKIMEKKEF